MAERAGLALVQQGALDGGGGLVRGAGKAGQAEGGPWEGLREDWGAVRKQGPL